jgi:AcrR family transcriptional regulator
VTQQTGRREASKQATRTALRDAATKLFADQGYEHTTVRDIAATAGVTERTFFRYFESKEDLVADQTLDWLPMVTAAITHRPAAEPPLVAVREAFIALNSLAATLDPRQPRPLWMFTDGPPGPRMRRSAPALLYRFEAALAAAVRSRLADGGPVAADYRAEIVARAAVAACRSAFIRDWQLRTEGVPDRPSLPELLRQAFTVLGDG